MSIRQIIIVVLLLSAQQGMAQDVEQQREEKWAHGGVLMLLAPDFDYYDKDLVRYDPPSPFIWFGGSWLNGGMMGDPQAQFPLRSGALRKVDCGFTIFQVSRNLYRGNVGVTAGLQIAGYFYDVAPTQNLTPLFKLADGTKAYPSSLTVGVDIWNFLCRVIRPSD